MNLKKKKNSHKNVPQNIKFFRNEQKKKKSLRFKFKVKSLKITVTFS